MRVGALALVMLGAAACGGHAHDPRGANAADTHALTSSEVRAPRAWVDELVDERRDVVLALSPRELARDPVFGSLFRAATDAALEHARERGASSSALEAVLRAEDVLLAVRDREGRDAVVIVSGIPSDLPPESIVDDAGRPLFVRVREREQRRYRAFSGAAPDRALHLAELPGGTWVLGIGAGARRVDEALARSESLSYAPKLHAPALARFSGELLQSLKERTGPGLRPVARNLEAATVTLSHDPAERARARLRLELAYASEPAADAARPTAERAAELLVAKLDFPVAPRVGREGRVVWVEVAIESAPPKPATSGKSE